MSRQSDVNVTKIILIGTFSTLMTVVVTLFAIVLYYSVADRVEQSRSDEAAERIRQQADGIAAGIPVRQPWLDADLQRATQDAQLTAYGRRTVTEEDKPERVLYSMPIEHAMETVLEETTQSASEHSRSEESER